MEEMIRVTEAARMIGIDNDTLRYWCDDGKFPHLKLPSGGYRFRKPDVEKWIQAHFRDVKPVEAKT
jgi:excisionase family DNA binding protein